jgi:hypothetical protein
LEKNAQNNLHFAFERISIRQSCWAREFTYQENRVNKTLKIKIKQINPVYYLSGALLFAIVVMCFAFNQTALTIFLELILLGVLVATCVFVTRTAKRIKDLSVLADAAATSESLRYLLSGIKKLKDSRSTSNLLLARTGLLSLHAAIVCKPSEMRTFVLACWRELSGEETVDAAGIGEWDKMSNLTPDLNNLEKTCLALQELVTNFLRASAGIGHDVKTLDERRANFVKALSLLTGTIPITEKEPATSVAPDHEES